LCDSVRGANGVAGFRSQALGNFFEVSGANVQLSARSFDASASRLSGERGDKVGTDGVFGSIIVPEKEILVSEGWSWTINANQSLRSNVADFTRVSQLLRVRSVSGGVIFFLALIVNILPN
jgi:hypothetical protein